MQTPQNVFRNGIALTTGLALTIDAYVFAKNLSIDALLFYSLPLVTLVFIGIAVTYFAYRRLDATWDLPTFFVISLHGIFAIECALLLLKGFIHYQIPYGYIFLPIVIGIVGAIILVSVVSIFRSKMNDLLKIALLVLSFVFITSALIFTK